MLTYLLRLPWRRPVGLCAVGALVFGSVAQAATAPRHAGRAPQLHLPEALSPPRRAAQGAPQLTLRRDASGTVSFLGERRLGGVPALASHRQTAAAADPLQRQIAALLRQQTGHPNLELRPSEPPPAELAARPRQTRAFVQQFVGVPIEGAYAVAQSHAGVLRYLRHHLVAPPTGLSTKPRLLPEAATARATTALRQAHPGARLQPHGAPQLRIYYAADGGAAAPDSAALGAVAPGSAAVEAAAPALRPHLAWRVEMQTSVPAQRLAVFVDAHDGATLGTLRLSSDAVSGQLLMQVEPRCQGDRPEPRPLPHTQWSWQGGRRLYTDTWGEFSSAAGLSFSRIELRSPYVQMTNMSGELAGPWRIPIKGNGAVAEALAGDGMLRLYLDDAPLDQATPYFHVLTVRKWLMDTLDYVNYQMLWALRPLELNINTLEACNATYDGSLNFAADGEGCLNTGRTAAIVYHEYAHGIHDHSPPPGTGMLMDDQVGEGIADYVAATLTDNPVMSGIHSCDDAFRSCANRLSFCHDWPCDVSLRSEAHDAGQVMCAVWWDFRTQMQQRYGSRPGRRKADQIFLHFLSLVGDFDSAYQAAIAADEDDDLDPSNGTLHSCELNRAFASEVPGAFVRFPDLQEQVPCVPKRRLSD